MNGTRNAIHAEGLSKSYVIRHEDSRRYVALRDVVTEWVASVLGRSDGRSRVGVDGKAGATEEFWALKDVSFTIPVGRRVGIVGRNGAGKSTLLKILSRITEPTEGRVELEGRVASLLEVGTGFHPELTGRENIYLNGSILGMKKEEVARNFDAIVSFAEVEQFLDTPVKRYSSGMYVRLAFAVAAHLDSDILVIDEVLAVGDAEFQRKCLARMNEISRRGRTILFVSHNMGAVRALCEDAIWLHRGRVRSCGAANAVVEEYLQSANHGVGGIQSRATIENHVQGTRAAELQAIAIKGVGGESQRQVLIGEPFDIDLDFRSRPDVTGTFWIFLCTEQGDVILSSLQKDATKALRLPSEGTARVRVEGINLLPGRFSIWAGILGETEIIDWVENAITFEVLPQYFDMRPFDHRFGRLTCQFRWTVSHEGPE